MGAPNFIKASFFYGKVLKKAGKTLEENYLPLQVPKSWFYHFYIFNLCTNGTIFIAILFQNAWLFDKISSILGIVTINLPLCASNVLQNNNGTLGNIVNCISSNKIKFYSFLINESFDNFKLKLTLSMIIFQASRRLYECLFVSIYSNTKQSLFAYFGACIYYGIQGLTVITGFKDLSSSLSKEISTLRMFICCFSFLLASFM